MLVNSSEIALPDYKDNAEAYELEEHARPDEMLMINGAAIKANALLDKLKNALVLDLCCGTGISMEGIIRHPNISRFVGVDISSQYLDFAINKFSKTIFKIEFIQHDAVTVPLPTNTWHVIILASAYHHIEDERKLDFLHHVHSLLHPNGRAFFAENILPEYETGNEEDYCKSVRFFYTEVLKTAKSSNSELPPYVEGLIARVAKYGTDGEYEYKVCKSIFLNHLKKANLEVVSEHRVWPNDGPLFYTTGGNYVLEVKKS